MSTRCLLLLGLTLVAAGCGNGDRVTVYPVRGSVMFDGKPMEGGGSISFVPLEGQSGKAAGGTIERDGRYVMSTYGDGDGSMAGKFRVVIGQSVWDEPMNRGDGQAGSSEPVRTIGEHDEIPAVYGDFQKSPLTVEVTRSNPPEVNFDLKRQP